MNQSETKANKLQFLHREVLIGRASLLLREKGKRYIASVSFGKDSLAMLYLLLETGAPLDEVVFYDTGMEFKAIYNLRDQTKAYLKKHHPHITFTELKPVLPFLYSMFEKPVTEKGGGTHNGYSWCGGRCRWGTTEKLKAIEKHCHGAVEYVGIAYDEIDRLIKERKGNKRFPLAEWGMTEADCLKHCYERDINWLEGGIDLYSILDRVSCWCCCNKNLKELKNYMIHLPEYWKKLKELQDQTERPMKYNKYRVEDLELRFKEELKKKGESYEV